MEQGRRIGCRSLGFLGGEPVLYPWIEDVVSRAVELGYRRIAICTNGTMLAWKHKARRLAAAGVTRLAISIHSMRPEVEDRLTGRAGSFDRKLEGLAAALDLNDEGLLPDGVALEAVLAAPVLPDLVEYCKFFLDKGVRDFRLNVMRPEGASANDREMVPNMRDVGEAIANLMIENSSGMGARILIGDLPLCVLPPHILANLDFLTGYIGELKDMQTHVSVMRADTGRMDRFEWTDRKTTTLKSKPAVCRECRLEPFCEGVWTRYLDLYGDGDFFPIP